jgi:methyl-accepting chemotaxis protein
MEQLNAELAIYKAELESRRFIERSKESISKKLYWQESDTVNSWAERVLEEIVHTVNGLQACMYMSVYNETPPYLQLVSTYAFDLNLLPHKIPYGQGILGQAALSNRSLLLNSDENDFEAHSSSGLVVFKPKAVLIQVLVYNQQVHGILEIASLDNFSQQQLDLLKSLSENLAANMKTLQNQQQIAGLLREAQAKSEQLLSQEEELRQNLEEMQAVQDNVHRLNNQLSQTLATIDDLVCVIEFDPFGNIIRANNLFLRTMGYSLSEIQGKHHSIFVDPKEANSDEYRQFWHMIGINGKSIKSEFQRITATGEKVWLLGAYNSIKNTEGKVTSVIKIATVTTDTKVQFDTVLNLIPESIVIINDNMEIIYVNQYIEKMFGYCKEELMGKNVNILMPSPDHENHDSYVRNYQRTGKAKIIGISRRVKAKRKNGEIFDVQLYLDKIQKVNEVSYVGIIQEISMSTESDLLFLPEEAMQEVHVNEGSNHKPKK